MICITSGGTTVPLEQRCVRYIDNFASGQRGAAATEYADIPRPIPFMSPPCLLFTTVCGKIQVFSQGGLCRHLHLSPVSTSSLTISIRRCGTWNLVCGLVGWLFEVLNYYLLPLGHGASCS